MSIPADSLWRCTAARFPQPVDEDDDLHAQFLMASIDQYNSSPNGTYYPVYRSSDGESDILRHVFRYDNAPYQYVFENGFEARRQAATPEELFCNLERYVNSGGRPLDTRRETTHVFVSTTISSGWHPSVKKGESVSIYRYEIYAPGGIEVAQTLRDRYSYPGQDEITFIEGIAPQYIRSAQLFRLTSYGRYTRRTRENTTLYINRNFNPQSHPERRLQIQNPVRYYQDENRRRRDLEIQEFRELPERRRRSLDTNDALIEYYEDGVTNVDNYIDSAFRSTRRDEVYIFIKKEYVLVNYAPGTSDDRIVNGPHFIGHSFPSLVGTAFAEYGIDAAFGCHDGDEAMIFSGNLCARINYAPWTTDAWIIKGPKTIRQMFPFFQGTNFEQGIDAAFESTRHGEAYLFKGSEYALIHYSSEHGRTLVAIRPIADGFPCLRGCEFERDVQAAFASHRANEAYLFKGNNYILLYFTPGDTKDYIIGGPKAIVPTNWPSLKDFVPRKNRGRDSETWGDKEEGNNKAASRKMIVGVIPTGDEPDGRDEDASNAERDDIQGEQQEYQTEGSRWAQKLRVYSRRHEQGTSGDASGWPKPNEEQDVRVYSRRHRAENDQVQGKEDTPLGQNPEVQVRLDSHSSSSRPF